MKLKSMFSFKAKVIEPCSKLLSKCKLKFGKSSLRAPTFRLPKRRSRPRGVRTRTVRFRKPFSFKRLSFPRCKPKTKLRRKRRSTTSPKIKKALRDHPNRPTKVVPKVRVAELLTVLFSLRKLPKEVDTDTSEHMADATSVSVSVSEGGRSKEPFPSPITPAFARISTSNRKDGSDDLKDSDFKDSSDDFKEESSDDFKEESSDDFKEESSDDFKKSSNGLVEVEDACRSFESYMMEMIVEEGKVKDLMDVEELLYCWRNLKSPIFIDLVCRFYGEVCKDLFIPAEEHESLETITSE